MAAIAKNETIIAMYIKSGIIAAPALPLDDMDSPFEQTPTYTLFDR
jgi:hypothetical protein